MIGELSAIATSICWAVGPIVASAGVSHLGTFRFSQARFFVASIGLFLLAIISGSIHFEIDQSFFQLVASGIIGITIGETIFFKSVHVLGPRRGSLLFVIHAPITAIIGTLIFLEQVTTQRVVGITITFIAVIVAIYSKNKDEIQADSSNNKYWIGLTCGLLAALCQSVGALLAKDALSNVTPINAAFLRTIAATVTFFPFFLLFRAHDKKMTPIALKYVLYSAAISTVGGMTFSVIALAYANISDAVILSSLSPIILIIILAITKGQKYSKTVWTGTFVGVFGVVLIILAANGINLI